MSVYEHPGVGRAGQLALVVKFKDATIRRTQGWRNRRKRCSQRMTPQKMTNIYWVRGVYREYGVEGRARDENRNKQTAKQRHIEAYVERD